MIFFGNLKKNIKLKTYRLTIVTENQNSIEKARALSKMIAQKIDANTEFEVIKYDKFLNSYQFLFEGVFKEDSNSIKESIIMTDKISSPWSVVFDRFSNEISLVFNKSEKSKFRSQPFNVIRWANFEVFK